MKLVQALNALTSQVWAILVLLIGCMMVVYTKKYGIDGTIAGGIIGVASNMLTGNSNNGRRAADAGANFQQVVETTTLSKGVATQ